MRVVQFPTGIASPPTSDDLNLRCESHTVPKKTIENNIINIRGQEVGQAGRGMYDKNITLTFVETVDSFIVEYFRQWREIISEFNTGTSVTKAEYQATFLLTLLDNQDVGRYEYRLNGVYPIDPTMGDTLTSEQDVIKPTVTFHYDSFKDRQLA